MPTVQIVQAYVKDEDSGERQSLATTDFVFLKTCDSTEALHTWLWFKF